MSETNRHFPYKILGSRLRQLREKLQESLADASGAVEIELDDLNRIEQGRERPSEDILLLLISHFALKEDEASRLWELAEYDRRELPMINVAVGQHDGCDAPVAGSDCRVLYTDMAQVTVSKYGVVLSFMQTGFGNQPTVVSRVGMSHQHAASVLEVLRSATTASVGPRALGPAQKVDERKSKRTKR
jgi:DNA-binding XRE family transcriptional regulator